MRSISLRVRLVLGLLAVGGVGLGTAEVATYYSVRSFMLNRVDEQVDAAAGPAAARLFVEDRFRGQGNILRNATNPADPVTGEVITGGGNPPGSGGRAAGRLPEPPRTFPPAFLLAPMRKSDSSTNPLPIEQRLSDSKRPIRSLISTRTWLHRIEGTTHFTVPAVNGAERFRVNATALPDGSAVLLVAVPMTKFDRTMERLQIVGGVTTVRLSAAVAALAFWLVRLGLRPLDEFAATAANVAAGDMSQRMPVATAGSEIRRLGTAMNDMLERPAGRIP